VRWSFQWWLCHDLWMTSESEYVSVLVQWTITSRSARLEETELAGDTYQCSRELVSSTWLSALLEQLMLSHRTAVPWQWLSAAAYNKTSAVDITVYIFLVVCWKYCSKCDEYYHYCVPFFICCDHSLWQWQMTVTLV